MSLSAKPPGPATHGPMAKARGGRTTCLYIVLLSIVALALSALVGQLPLPSLVSFDKAASIPAEPFTSPSYNMVSYMNHDASGWHNRSTKYTGKFAPTKDTLILTLLFTTPGEDFAVALVKPNIAVDAYGKVLAVPQADFDSITSLTTAVVTLPDVPGFPSIHDRLRDLKNEERIPGGRIEWLLYTGHPLHRNRVTGVGHQLSIIGKSTMRTLAEAKARYKELPDPQLKLFGWLVEGAAGHGQKDEGPIDKVRALLPVK